MKHIESTQNPAVKSLLQLQQKAQKRKDLQRFVLEGVREIELAIEGGFDLEMLYICSSLLEESKLNTWGNTFQNRVASLSSSVYNKLAYRGSTEGAIAVFKTKSHALSDLKLGANPLLLIAESPEKPGNLGALLRTAEAAGVDAVIIADPLSDIYNPNTLRASVGAAFNIPIAIAKTNETIDFLLKNKVRILAATLQNSIDYAQMDCKGATAIVVGTESEGLSMAWRNAAWQNICIPMQGKIDSMNVSVAAAVLIFEAQRKRKNLE